MAMSLGTAVGMGDVVFNQDVGGAARRLAMHHLVAAKLRERPELLARARTIVTRWMEMHGNRDPYWSRWLALLDHGLNAVIAVAEEESESANDMRQSSPLLCLLGNAERWAFLQQWKRERAH